MNDLQEKANGTKKVIPGTDNKAKTEQPGKEQTPPKKNLQDAKTELAQIMNPASAEQRIKNAEIFTKLADKYQFLKKKKDHLNNFMASRDGLKEKLFIVSDNEENFEISNSRIIEKILEVCQDELEGLLKTSETEISTFTI